MSTLFKSPTNFSLWMRDHLKDAYSGLITQDLDFIVQNNNKQYFIVEEKNLATAKTGPAQAVIYKMLADILSDDNQFLGCHKATVMEDGIFLDQCSIVSFEEFMNNPNRYKLNKYGQTWFDKILYFNTRYLWDGRGVPKIKKTEKEHTYHRPSKLYPIFKNKNINFSKVDWIFVNYVSGYFVLLGETDFCYDNLVKHIVEKLNEYTCSDKIVTNPKSCCEYKFLGFYNLSYKNDFSIFKINNHILNPDDAIRILNLDSNEICKYK